MLRSKIFPFLKYKSSLSASSGYRNERILTRNQFYVDAVHMRQKNRVPKHTDGYDGIFKVWRIIITVKKANSGGELISEKFIINLPRIKLFRADKYEHYVTEILEGERKVLAITLLTRR